MLIKVLSIIVLIFLASCDNNPCEWNTDQKLRAELFDKCLVRAAEARHGNNYTTHNSEDYDDVVKACGQEAYYMAQVKTCKSTSN